MNDGSTNNSVKLLSRFSKTIKYFNQENSGPEVERNKANNEATDARAEDVPIALYVNAMAKNIQVVKTQVILV